MVTVAVAGGTGSVGKTIVDAIVKAGKHRVIVLTRKVHGQAPFQEHHHAVSNSDRQASMALRVPLNVSLTTPMLSKWLEYWNPKRSTRSSQPLQSWTNPLASRNGLWWRRRRGRLQPNVSLRAIGAVSHLPTSRRFLHRLSREMCRLTLLVSPGRSEFRFKSPA